MSLAFKIVQDPPDPIPDRYSDDLKNLVESILTKDDKARPTTGNILDLPFLQKYMRDFLEEREKASKKAIMEDLASATAKLQMSLPAIPSKKEAKKAAKRDPRKETSKKIPGPGQTPGWTARQRFKPKKEEENKKNFELMCYSALPMRLSRSTKESTALKIGDDPL